MPTTTFNTPKGESVTFDELSPEDQRLVRKLQHDESDAKLDAQTQSMLHNDSVRRGEREAVQLGLRKAVDDLLGARAAGVLPPARPAGQKWLAGDGKRAT